MTTGPLASEEDSDAFSLRGTRVLITGAGRGLARGIALTVARAGAEVIGVSRSATHLQETGAAIAAAGGRFTAVPADLSRLDDLDALVQAVWEAGPIHGVVHGAGIQSRKPAVEVSIEDWRAILAIQLEAPFFLSTALARRQLATSSGGSHVFIGSLATTIALRNVVPYNAAKSGLMGVVRTLALEWATAGIRVNTVAPGYFLTDLTKDLLSDQAQHSRILSRIPMGRLGTADDLGGTFVFLLSDASRYLTGQLVNLDGGWLAS